MKAIQETVNNTFKPSKKLNEQIIIVAELKNKLFDSLNDEQTLLFIKFIAEGGDLLKMQINEHIDRTYQVCKVAFKLR